MPGILEPESGSDLASLKARAVKTNGSWKVTGQKVWTTYAHDGEVVHAACALGSGRPQAQGDHLLHPRHGPARGRGRPLRQITGEAEFNEIFLEEAEVPRRT